MNVNGVLNRGVRCTNRRDAGVYTAADAVLLEARMLREDAAEGYLHLGLRRLRLRGIGDGQEALLGCALETALKISGTLMGNIQLFDPRVGGLEIRAQRGFKGPFLDFFERVTDTNSACGQALVKGRHITVPDVTDSPIFRRTRALEVLLDAGVRAVHSTPLIDSVGQVRGVLSVHFAQSRRLLGRDAARLEILADEVGSLLEGAVPRPLGRRLALC